MNGHSELIQELKSLRKGRGLLAGRIGERIGPTLRSACAVAEGDGLVVIRTKVASRLTELAEQLPADLRLAAMAAFAISAEARQPLYKDRLRWTAKEVDRDPRTVRRRVDEAITLLADLATGPVPAARPTPRWRTSELSLSLLLDPARPELLERHCITADQDDLRELTLPIPPPPAEPTLFHGGRMTTRGASATVTLPNPLSRGESHEVVILHRLPETSSVPPHLTYTPSHPCAHLDVRVRFANPPREIHELPGTFPQDVRDHPGRPHIPPQKDELHLRFHELTPGLTYGAHWTPGTH